MGGEEPWRVGELYLRHVRTRVHLPEHNEGKSCGTLKPYSLLRCCSIAACNVCPDAVKTRGPQNHEKTRFFTYKNLVFARENDVVDGLWGPWKVHVSFARDG